VLTLTPPETPFAPALAVEMRTAPEEREVRSDEPERIDTEPPVLN
jgi:hypothetical protein